MSKLRNLGLDARSGSSYAGPMGLDYSFVHWVRRDTLPSALEALARRARGPRGIPARFDDGTVVMMPGSVLSNAPEVRVGPSGESWCLSLTFAGEDEHIRDYGEDVGCIYLDCGLAPQNLDWLGDAPMYVPVSLSAATSDMSRLFLASPTVKTTFVLLGREMGAVCCELDIEEDEAIVLDRSAHHRLVDEAARHEGVGSRSVFLEPGDPELTSPERALKSWCETITADHHAYDDFDRLLELMEHPSSCLRGASLRALERIDPSLVTDLACRSLVTDLDWRVRTVAATVLMSPSPSAIDLLFAALADPVTDVRSAAADAVAGAQADDRVFARLLTILHDGTDMTVWSSVASRIGWRPYDPPRRTPLLDALRQRYEDPGFPLRHQAASLLRQQRFPGV